ncbi:MAG: phage GP46 family protein [Leptospiraceae bacterium]|nr:phage GP46 family protein [Leptospiraceae bacterium]
MSDLLLHPTIDGGDVIIAESGDFTLTDAMFNAAYLSVHTDSGWWGNELLEQNERLNGRLNELQKKALTNQTRLAAIDYAKKSLKWLTDTGIAASVEVDAVIKSAVRLDLTITVTKPDGDQSASTYPIAWNAQIEEYA